MRHLFFSGILILSAIRGWGQEAPNMKNSISGTPNAVASSKRANIPVNHFTGITMPSIGIHEYSRNRISNNVSVDYFGGGVKVDEKASNIGLNFQVNTGGVIVRNLRSLPDDFPVKGYLYTPVVDPGQRIGRDVKRYTFDAYGKDSIDAEQDIFQYNIGGKSGSFVIGKNGKVVNIPNSNVKIRYKTGSIPGVQASTISEFTIIFEDGSRYLFSTPEITTRDVSYYDWFRGYVSSWYLTSITSAFAEDTISFKYKSVLSASYVKSPASRFDRSGEAPINYNDSQYVRVDEKYIEQIVYPYNQTVNFTYDTQERADLKGSYALKSIELRDSVLRMGYSFEHQYFSDNGTVYPYGSTNSAISKLRLYRIWPYTQFRTMRPYIFSYSTLKVPKVGSNSQDHYGYFNNKANTDMIPPAGPYTGADRNVDSTYARSGMLNAIKYPSGGVDSFNYESNYRRYSFRQENGSVQIGTAPSYLNSISFQVDRFSTIPAQLNLSVGRSIHCPVKITLKNASNQIIDTFSTDGSFSGTFKTYNVPGGIYTLSMAAINSCGSTNVPECYLKWVNEVQDSTNSLMGGLRIRDIFSLDSLGGAPPSVRSFRYLNVNGTSSGFAFYVPKYDYEFNTFQRNGPNNKTYLVRVSAPMNNLDYVWGAAVGYGRVEEIIPGNGKTVHEFTTYKDLNYFPPQPQFPFAAKPYPSWELGLEKKMSAIDQYNQVKSITENHFDLSATPLNDTAFKSVKLMVNEQYYSLYGYIGPSYDADTYYALTGNALLDSTVEKLFNGTDSLISSTAYSFDSLDNVVQVRKWMSKDLQSYVQTDIYYPYHYTVTGGLKILRDSGIIIPVAQEQWVRTPGAQQLIAASVIGYDVITGNKVKAKYTYGFQSDKPVAYSVMGAFNPAVLNRNTTIVPLLNTIERFDSKLVPLQSLDNLAGTRQSVIYDDEHQQVIAAVTGAAYADVAYTSFEGVGNGNWTIGVGQINYSDAVTGARSFRLNGTITATVTTGKEYVVTYWTQGSGITINGTTAEKLTSERVWNLYRNKLPSTTTTISLTGSNLIIDELRAYPADAVMTTSSYGFFGNQTSICSENNKISYTEVDDLGRPRIIEDVEGNILELNCFGQAGERVNCSAVYKNNAISRSFVKNNCSSGVPDTVTYTIAAGTYTSTVSQYRADSTAMVAVMSGGQSYANTNGGCGTVYAKLSYEDLDLDRAEDVVVKFYSDAACTQPKSVQNLQVNITITGTCENPTDYDRTVSGTEAIIIGAVIRDYEKTECDPPGYPCWTFQCHVDHVLKAGNYVIK